MAYLLDSTEIRSPHSISETNNTQYAQQRSLSGSISRDIFGSNKRVWELVYNYVNSTDYTTIKTIYNSYLNTNTTKDFEITEANYTVSAVKVHIDLQERGFTTKGSDYLSSFTLTLTEA